MCTYVHVHLYFIQIKFEFTCWSGWGGYFACLAICRGRDSMSKVGGLEPPLPPQVLCLWYVWFRCVRAASVTYLVRVSPTMWVSWVQTDTYVSLKMCFGGVGLCCFCCVVVFSYDWMNECRTLGATTWYINAYARFPQQNGQLYKPWECWISAMERV